MTADHPKNPIDLDLHLPSQIQTLGNKISLHALRGIARPANLDLREWRIILILGAQGKSTINEVADRVAMDRGGTSRAISRLEDRGLVNRFQDANDRRRSLVALSTTGIKLHDKLSKFAHEREKDILRNLSSKEHADLGKTLGSLIARIDTMLVEENQ